MLWPCVYQLCQHYKLHSNYCYSMSVPVSQLTVEQAHKKFNSLTDKIAAKYEQLVSGKFGAVGTTGFNAKSAKFGMSLCLYKHSCKT